MADEISIQFSRFSAFYSPLIATIAALVLTFLGWLAWEWITFPDVQKLAKERPTGSMRFAGITFPGNAVLV